MSNRLAELIATCGGLGYLPKAPGTWGSLGAVALAAGLPYPAIFAAAFLFPGIWAAGRMAKTGGRDDPQHVVIDEAVGQWIALAGGAHTWQSVLAAFVLFRFFDIFKPWPVNALERLPGGWGIMMDDVMAGIYAFFVMLALRWFNLIS